MSIYTVSPVSNGQGVIYTTNVTNATLPPSMVVQQSSTLAPIVTSGDYVSQTELDSEVFDISVDKLINLWLARFGTDWVDLITVEDDNFYRLVYKRLKSLGQLEQHYLTDRSRYVCRKPE